VTAAPLLEPGPPSRRRRLIAAALVAVVALVILTVPWWGRHLAFFRVHDVEVRGTRFAKASDIASRLAIDTLHSIWEPLDSL